MTKGSGNCVPHLKLVPSKRPNPAAGANMPRVIHSTSDVDWAILMARAQEGDSAAYIGRLEEMTPYLRLLALRWYHDRQDT
jgi:hypothetical protein